MGIKDEIYFDTVLPMQNNAPDKFFALTAKEHTYIVKADSIREKTISKYSTLNEQGEQVIPGNFYEILAAEMQKKRASLAKVEKIAEKAFTGNWYTVTIAGDKEESNDLTFYMINYSTHGKTVYLDDNHDYYSLFFKNNLTPEEFCLEERRLLGLPSDCKFIDSSDYFTLLKFVALKKTHSERGSVEGNWKLKSSPMLIMPVKIGKAVLANAVKGKLIERERSILTVGNYKASYTPNKAAVSFLKGNINAQKLLDLIQHEAYLTGYKTSRLKIPLKKILEIRGLKDMKELKKQITSAATILDDMNFTGSLGGGDFDKVSVTQGDTSIIQGYLYVNISEKFLEGLRNTRQEMLYNPELQKLPSLGFSYGFARIFEEHKRINAGKPNENRIAVSTLLEASPYVSYDELEDKGQAGQRIIERFLKCFDIIEEQGIFSSRLCKQGGEYLTDEEMERCLTDYYLFSSLMIEVEYPEGKEPDYSRIIDLKAKANGAAGTRKKHASSKPEQKKPAKKKSESPTPSVKPVKVKPEAQAEQQKPAEKKPRKKQFRMQIN